MKRLTKCLIKDKEKYLLIKREPNSKFFPNKWDFPGGKSKLLETDAACGIREAKEETNLDIVSDKIVKKIIIFALGIPFRIRILSVKSYSGDIKLSKDHTEFAWFTKKEMKDIDLSPVVKKIILS
ncbi:MAG: NUDIX hydrolase [archaeon]